MTQHAKRPIQPSKGFFKNIGDEIRLVFRLLGDPRIPWYLKVLPFGSFLYFIFPDIAPGPIDDALVIGIGIYLFIELCPPEIVDEHRMALRNVVPGEWRDAEVIEGEYSNDDSNGETQE